MLCSKVPLPVTSKRIARRRITREVSVFLLLLLMGYTLHVKLGVAHGATSHPKEIIEAEGFGLPGTNAKNHDERCVFARRAAEINARRALAESIKSYVEAAAQSVNMSFSEEKTKIVINQTLIGSKIIQVEEYDGCNRVKVKVRSEIDLEKISSGNTIDGRKE